MSINVDGVVYGARAVLPGMNERGSGDIVVTASMAGLHPIAKDPVYGLTKHGVVGFVRSLAAWLQQTPDSPDICVSAICPGFADTAIIGDEARSMLGMLGVETCRPTVSPTVWPWRSPNGSRVIWPGVDTRVYEWVPAISDTER
jgi:NAD(P)-dependent dehydrogenase (short-subunit alcohol dehydrogenase family)